MKYKTVVCDMDGTLLNAEHRIGDFTKETIENLVKHGITIFLATGRPHMDARYFRDQLGLASYTISSNGARVYDAKDKLMLAHDIPANIVKDIIEFKTDDDYHRNIYCQDSWLVEVGDDGLLEFHKESGLKFDIVDFNDIKSTEVTKFFYLNDNEHRIYELEKSFRNRYADDISITPSSPTCLELMAKNVNKARAIKEVSSELDISLSETLIFGDGLNDYEMLSIAGKGFIMENATDRLKNSLPHLEVIGNFKEEAVAKKLREIYKNIF